MQFCSIVVEAGRFFEFGAFNRVPSSLPSWLTQFSTLSLILYIPLAKLSRNNNSEQLELLEEKLRELAALPRGDSRSDDDRAVALSQVDALRKELALVCRAGLPSVVFGKVSLFLESERKGAGGRARESE